MGEKRGAVSFPLRFRVDFKIHSVHSADRTKKVANYPVYKKAQDLADFMVGHNIAKMCPHSKLICPGSAKGCSTAQENGQSSYHSTIAQS